MLVPQMLPTTTPAAVNIMMAMTDHVMLRDRKHSTCCRVCWKGIKDSATPSGLTCPNLQQHMTYLKDVLENGWHSIAYQQTA